MNYLRKKDDICYTLASMQARIYERSAEDGIPSYFFVQEFMHSIYAHMLDDLSFLESGLSELEIYMNVKDSTAKKQGEVYSPEIMHWIGFFYRYASYLTGISSRKLFKHINPKKLSEAYPLYHGLDIQKAVEMVFDSFGLDNKSPMDRFYNLYKAKKIVL